MPYSSERRLRRVPTSKVLLQLVLLTVSPRVDQADKRGVRSYRASSRLGGRGFGEVVAAGGLAGR